MKKGTKITNKAYPFNPDGDHDIHFDRIDVRSEVDYNTDFDDPDYFLIKIHKGKIFGVNKLKFKGRRFPLLEPNPVTFYFSMAFDAAQQIEHAHKQLEKSLSNSDSSWPLSVSYSYVFKVATMGIVFGYTACEAFLNQKLPDFKEILMNDAKYYDKKHIEERFGFERKVTAVSIHTQKDFVVQHPRKMERLIKLKELRHQLIHLKEVKQGMATSYNDIYQSILDLNLKIMVNTVKSFINFYEPKMIVNYSYNSSKT